MSLPIALTRRPLSSRPESDRPAQCAERIPHTVTPEQIHAVLRDIIRRDPDLWTRVQRDRTLWHAFGFDTEAENTESSTASVLAG